MALWRSHHIEVHLFRRAPAARAKSQAGFEFLLLRRAAGRRLSGVWQPVTGKAEGREPLWAAAAREVYEETGLKDDDWRKYMRDFHTSSSELAAIATKAKPKLLVLYHLLFVTRAVHADEIVGEVKRGYGGRVVAAKDLDVF